MSPERTAAHASSAQAKPRSAAGPRFSATFLAKVTGGRWTSVPRRGPIGFSIDSRRLRRGQMFVALRTERRDGHDYLEAARTAGAAAALVAVPDPAVSLPQLVVRDPEAAFQAIAREHRRRFKGPVIGVSGSAGKTSTKDLLALLLGGPGGVLASEGNLNNQLGVPLTLTQLDPARHRFAVIEAGIGGPGEMEPLASMIEPDIALITLVAPAHLGAFKDLEEVARSKAVLPGAVSAAGVAIFPSQCERFTAFRELEVRKMVLERAEVVRPSVPPSDRIYFTVTQRGESTAISLAYGPPPPLVFTVRRISDGMAQNAALALCAALWLGVPHEQIQERLASWTVAPLRGEWRDQGGRRYFLDCYNANPASMADSLQLFASLAPESDPRVYVVGGMEELGPAAETYHRELGAAVPLRPQDLMIAIGDHARAVKEGALAAARTPGQIAVAGSPDEIAASLADFHGAVFVKGSRRWQLERILQ